MHIFIINGIGGHVSGLYPLRDKILKELPTVQVTCFHYESRMLTIANAVTIITNELDKITDPPVVLVGHSMGGCIVAQVQHPSVIHRITVSSPLQGSWMAWLAWKAAPRWSKRRVGNAVSELAAGNFQILDPSTLTCFRSRWWSLLPTDGTVFSSEMSVEGARCIDLSGFKHRDQIRSPVYVNAVFEEIKRIVDGATRHAQ
jgi:hypothetical protein